MILILSLYLSEAFPPETAAILFLGNFEKPFCFTKKTIICLSCQQEPRIENWQCFTYLLSRHFPSFFIWIFRQDHVTKNQPIAVPVQSRNNTTCQIHYVKNFCRFKILKIYFHLPGHGIHLSHLLAHLFATRNGVLYFSQANIFQLFLLRLKKGIRLRLSIFFGTFCRDDLYHFSFQSFCQCAEEVKSVNWI